MKVKELKELLSNYNDDQDICVRNSNGAIVNKVKISEFYYLNEKTLILE